MICALRAAGSPGVLGGTGDGADGMAHQPPLDKRFRLSVDRRSPEFPRPAVGSNPGADTLAIFKSAVYEDGVLTRFDAVEPEKGRADA